MSRKLSELSPRYLRYIFAFGNVFYGQAVYADTGLISYQPDDVVVTATRTSIPVGQATSDISIISQAQIRNAGQTSLVELLQAQPELEIAQNGGAGTPAGIFIRGANSDHTLVLIDGVRAGSLTTGVTPLETISLDQIDHIEILRGAASSLYGSDAIGGVIQIFTRQGAGEPKLDASAGLGSYGTRQAQAGYAGQIDATRFSMGAGYDQTDGFPSLRPGYLYYTPYANGDENYSAHFNLDQMLDTDNHIGLLMLYNRDRNAYDAGSNNDYAINQVNSAAAYWNSQFNPDWYSQLQISRGQNNTQNFGSYADIFNSQQNQYQWQNNFNLPVGVLSATIERNEQQVSADTAYTLTGRNINSAQLGYQANLGAHSLQASGRYDDYSDFGGHATGNLGYGYRISPTWQLHSDIGTAYHAPTFNDMYYPYTNYGYGYAYSGNPLLQPEQSSQAELGARYHQGDNLFSLIVYENQIKNLIIYNGATVPSTMSNIADARIQGLTLTTATVIAAYTLTASYDLQNPEDNTTGNLLVYRARQHGTVEVNKTWRAWVFDAQAIASGMRYDDAANTIRLGGYTLLNLRANYQVSPEWTVIAKLDNVFNKDYQLINGYNTPGANVFFGVAWRQK